LVREHGDALEADMQQHFGIELADLYRGRLSLRRLRVLIDHLPVESRTARSLADAPPELAHWTLDSALLGRLVDEMSAMRWTYESAHVEPRDRRPPPKSVLPHAEQEPEAARVIPLVSPHRLGPFINDDVRGDDRGD
jgi:hypothetical protein